MTDDADEVRARKKRLGVRIVIAVYGGFAAAFVALAAWQITVQCFEVTAAPIDRSTPAGSACVAGLTKLHAALERAAARAARAGDAATALQVFEKELSPEWSAEPDVRARCAADPRGNDAFAALLRLRMAEQSHAARDATELAALRQGLEAYLK